MRLVDGETGNKSLKTNAARLAASRQAGCLVGGISLKAAADSKPLIYLAIPRS